MQAATAPRDDDVATRRLSSRGDLTAYLMTLSEEVGADSYMLLGVVHKDGRTEARIVASNWIFDAIELAGPEMIARIAEGPIAASPGVRATGLDCTSAPASLSRPTAEEARFLHILGHGEIFSLRLNIGRQRLYLLLSSEEPAAIQPDLIRHAHIECCYALSHVPQLLATAAPQNSLTDRERECLVWVCEGKTTDEVSLILGVSANTVNSYIANAIHKLSASNRVMAVATAIRGGII